MADPNVTVPHYEPVSSGVHYEPDHLPDWFQKKVNALAAGDGCARERDAMQKCIDKHTFWTTKCREVLDVYDICQQNAFTPEYAEPEDAKK